MKTFLPFLLLSSFLFLFTACKPKIISGGGISFITMRGANASDLMYRYQEGENTVQINVDNVSLYKDIYGKILNESTALPISVSIEWIDLLNVRVSAARNSREDLVNYISDCELILQPLGGEEVVMASMVESSNIGIAFAKENPDILSSIEDKDSRLFFKFTFKETPPAGIDVFYDMTLHYKYVLEIEEE